MRRDEVIMRRNEVIMSPVRTNLVLTSFAETVLETVVVSEGGYNKPLISCLFWDNTKREGG